jgi:hypothetical protein
MPKALKSPPVYREGKEAAEAFKDAVRRVLSAPKRQTKPKKA